MVHENTIYGFRRGLAREPYYYICTYNDDCSKTQHLTEVDFIRILKERGLPEYISRIAQTYDELLLVQSKTDIGKKVAESIILPDPFGFKQVEEIMHTKEQETLCVKEQLIERIGANVQAMHLCHIFLDLKNVQTNHA